MKSDTPLIFSDSSINESLLPSPIAWEWIIAAAVAVIIIATVLLIHKFRGKSNHTVKDRKDAYRVAIQSLNIAASLPARAAATQASLALRQYLCSAASDPSLFETHEEFLIRHPSISNIPPETLESLIDTLKRLAEIKYRRAEEPADASELLDQSRELLDALNHSSAA